jgi:hypothetical protein
MLKDSSVVALSFKHQCKGETSLHKGGVTLSDIHTLFSEYEIFGTIHQLQTNVI